MLYSDDEVFQRTDRRGNTYKAGAAGLGKLLEEIRMETAGLNLR